MFGTEWKFLSEHIVMIVVVVSYDCVVGGPMAPFVSAFSVSSPYSSSETPCTPLLSSPHPIDLWVMMVFVSDPNGFSFLHSPIYVAEKKHSAPPPKRWGVPTPVCVIAHPPSASGHVSSKPFHKALRVFQVLVLVFNFYRDREHEAWAENRQDRPPVS